MCSDLVKKAFYTYRNGSGHYCGPTRLGEYKMSQSWIDTDNTVWSEPYSLYTDSRDDVPYTNKGECNAL